MTSLAAAAAQAVTAPGSRFDLLPVVRTLGLVVASMLGLVLLVVAARRLNGARQLHLREELTRQVRPLLLEVLAEDDPDPDAVQRLVDLGRSQWRAAEPMLITMLGKVRGGSRDALIEVLAARGALRRAAEQTRSRSLITRCRAAEMLGAARRVEHVPTLTRLLEDPQPEVRRVAIRSLGRIGSADAAEPLLRSVSGDPPTSSMDVSAALVLLAPDATAVLARIARESTSDVERSVAAEVLGLRGAVVSAPTLIAMMQDSDSPEVQIRAARALGRIGDPRAVQALSEALGSSDVRLRTVAARALGELGAADAISALAGHLDDPDHRVATNAAEALCRLGDGGYHTLVQASMGDNGRAAGHAREALAMQALGKTAEAA